VLLLGAVVVASQRRWALALVLAVAAGAVKAPAFVAVPAIIAVHLQGYRGRRAWQFAGRDLAIAAGGAVAVSFVVRNGWGWIHALNTPALGHTSLAPATLVSDVLRPLVPSASFDDLAAGGRITALAAAGCVVIYLIATARTRALDRTVGYGILTISLLSPVVYPWYLLGGIVCLAPTARGARRDWIVWVSAIGCLLSPPGFTSGLSTVLSVAAIVIALVVIAPRVLARQHAAAQLAAAGPSVSAGERRVEHRAPERS
jgi:alpha-1,6-mannosyltransferase